MMDKTVRLGLVGLDCATCARKLEQALKATEGLEDTKINFATSTIEVASEHLIRAEEIISSIEPDVGIITREKGRGDRASRSFIQEQKGALIKISTSFMLLILGMIFEEQLHELGPFRILEYIIFLGAYFLVGLDVLKASIRNILRGDVFDENALMTIATLGAIAIHQLPEAVAVMLFYSIGETLQDYAVNRSRKSITSLVSIRPDQARVLRDGAILSVDPERVQVGEELIVKPGERIPLDGEIIEGESYVDTSALTGESVPRRLAVGEEALAGMVNTRGMLTIKVKKPFGESAISRILKLVEDAAGRKATTEKVITSFARYYTPAVVALAFAVAIIPPLVRGAAFSTWLYRALVLLVISCPCALVISVPLGYFGGIGSASRSGVLIKGANYLDVLAKLDTVVFDKTGTLTQGTFEVTQITPEPGFTWEDVLKPAATLEALSPHPIASSILAAYGREVDSSQITDYEEVTGHGIKGVVQSNKVVVGTDRFLHKEEVPHSEAICRTPGTIAHVAVNGQYRGYITISDLIKPEAAAAIEDLRSQGLENLIMLTGDDKSVANHVSEKLALDEAYAELLPEDKVNKTEELEARPEIRKMAFVGDGINDAPVLMRADVGIAMGALGSDAAIEAADVVIMDDDLKRLPQAIKIAKKTRRIVFGNIIFALGVKSIFMLLGVLGFSGIWLAVFADVGVSLLAILNSTRVLRYRP
jgi:Cd2+/Zn2+-exporting ATPase